ncbi:unnamed protein product [Microthlaspi erraticum]|uniref:DUF1985 domain-containing protein n=2 Tax=Microthlaspi erraticum TaxID=1685480 RepID=A0A6D2IBB1_9BRAS|nr:unnamed protein product [Microthlaspi erraticum]
MIEPKRRRFVYKGETELRLDGTHENLEKVLAKKKKECRKKKKGDVESASPEIGAEKQRARPEEENENSEETRSERELRGDPPTGAEGAEDGVGSDGGSQSLRDPPTGEGARDGSDGGRRQSESDPDSSYSGEEEEEEVEPMRPLRMYFPPTEYTKKVKISTRCYLHDLFETFRDLRPKLTDKEKNWFETHPQFKHIFHMSRDRNHKLQGIWTLLLRTACIEKKKEVWFIVNGVPIRYGLREHALISGLYSHNYPSGFAENKSGKMAFVEKLRMLILYFLASIIKGQTKTGKKASSVDPFLLRAVGDLSLCRTFPWGRLSYDHMLEGISKTMTHFNGAVPGLEKQTNHGRFQFLAFEAIPQLGERFLQPFPGADEECPKMCKSMFKKCDMKGIPFERISAQLGTTKDIDNILTANASEKRLLERITEPEDDVDEHCVVVESWMKLAKRSQVVFLKDMYDEDVARLAEAPPQNHEAVNTEAVNPEAVNTPSSELIELIQSMKKEMEERMTTIEKKVDRLEVRIAPIEAYVNEQTAHMRMEDDNICHDISQGSKERDGNESGDRDLEDVAEGLRDPPQVRDPSQDKGLEEPPQVRDPLQDKGEEEPPHADETREEAMEGAMADESREEAMESREEAMADESREEAMEEEDGRDKSQEKEVDDVSGKEKESEPEKEKEGGESLDSVVASPEGNVEKEGGESLGSVVASPKRPISHRPKLKVHLKRDRDGMNEKRDEGKRQKREKLLEEANQPRVSTRVAGKIEKKAAEKVEKERKNAEEKLEKERKKAEEKAEKERKKAEEKAEKERKKAEVKAEKEKKKAEMEKKKAKKGEVSREDEKN